MSNIPNFVLIPPIDHSAELLRLVPPFSDSREYNSLDEESRNIPGLVFAGFTKFLEASLYKRDLKDVCFKAIEHFASCNDQTAENLLVTEVFENFSVPENVVSFLLPKSKALYDYWIRKVQDKEI